MWTAVDPDGESLWRAGVLEAEEGQHAAEPIRD
jgi:hypothetical protein